MNRICTRWWLPLVMVCVIAPSSAQAQLARRPALQATAQPGVVSQGELRGIVQDDRGESLSGAVVSFIVVALLLLRRWSGRARLGLSSPRSARSRLLRSLTTRVGSCSAICRTVLT